MITGIVEGFYGPMWDLLDRISLLMFISRVGMNTYIYGPKWDPFHRDRWRSPYPQNLMNEFSLLVDESRRAGVEFVYAISPGLDIDYSSKCDLALLVRKLERLMDLGIESIAIFLDDIPPVVRGKGFRTLAEAQAKLVNEVFKELTPRKLIFCPTFYWGFNEKYIKEMGEVLNGKTHVMWTGPYVVSPRISENDVRKVVEIMGRKPLIWDNYPVNDYFLAKGVIRLHMGPLINRDPGLKDHISGYVANPMNQAEASKFPLYTVACFLRRERYDPRRSSEEAVRLLVNDEVQEDFNFLIGLNSASPMHPEGDEMLRKDNLERALTMVGNLRRDLNNRKLLNEVEPVLAKIELLVRTLKKGKSVKKLASMSNVQTCGEYEPPLTEEEMIGLFGSVIRVNRLAGGA